MHGTNFAARTAGRPTRLLPAASFREPRINASEPACKLVLTSAGFSKRPFARPQRSPVSRPPLRGQWSRPISSMPRETCLEPVRPLTPPLLPVCGKGDIDARSPLPDLRSTLSIYRRMSLLIGAFEPLRFNASIRFPIEKRAYPPRPMAFAPRRRVYCNSTATDPRSRPATLREACCSSTSWNLFDDAIWARFRQTNFSDFRRFSSKKILCNFRDLPDCRGGFSVDKTRFQDFVIRAPASGSCPCRLRPKRWRGPPPPEWRDGRWRGNPRPFPAKWRGRGYGG